MLREVRLYGHLAKRFGRVHRFDVASAAEAVRALCANFPHFERHVVDHDQPGYRVLIGDRPVMEFEEIRYQATEGARIKIVPVVAGAKKGWGKIVGGAVLIALGAIISIGSAGLASQVGAGLMKAGWAMAAAGVVQLLTPMPRSPSPRERPENQPSYFFDGPVNTTAQGHPVPLLYGRMIVGSAVVSAGLSAEEIAIPQPPPPAPPPLPAEQEDLEYGKGA